MFVYTQSGFKNAPISKFLIYNQVLIPIIVSLLDVRYLFDLQIMPHLLVWRKYILVFLYLFFLLLKPFSLTSIYNIRSMVENPNKSITICITISSLGRNFILIQYENN